MAIPMRRSLWFRLILGLVVGSLCAVLVASGFLYVRFKNVSNESRERTLQGQAKLIAHLFQSAGGRELVLPELMAPYYGEGAGRFAVLFGDETLIAASPGVAGALHPIDRDVNREFFSYAQPDGKPAYHGISLRIKGSSPRIWVQVAFADNEVIFDSVLEEFVIDIAWSACVDRRRPVGAISAIRLPSPLTRRRWGIVFQCPIRAAEGVSVRLDLGSKQVYRGQPRFGLLEMPEGPPIAGGATLRLGAHRVDRAAHAIPHHRSVRHHLRPDLRLGVVERVAGAKHAELKHHAEGDARLGAF